jgi:serine/threonine protein phosphatase 1
MSKKKLFVVSDVHSFYEPLISALAKAGFDKNNKNHYLVVCGDAFDRGPDSVKVLHFLMSIDRKILVKGNHDILFESCCNRGWYTLYDIRNGTKTTIDDLGGADQEVSFDQYCLTAWNKTAAYRSLLVNYFETENYIFVHSWLPVEVVETTLPSVKCYKKVIEEYKYLDTWREASDTEWEEAMWGNPFEKSALGLNKTGKTIVFGHWHCSAGWAKDEERSEFGPDAEWNPYYGKDIIGIDRCTAHTDEVNVLVLEDNFLEASK